MQIVNNCISIVSKRGELELGTTVIEFEDRFKHTIELRLYASFFAFGSSK